MPHSRSASRPSSIASAKRVRWRQAAHLHGRRVRALRRRRAQPLDAAVLLVGLVQAAEAEQGGVAARAHRDERGGVGRGRPAAAPRPAARPPARSRRSARPGRRRAAAAPTTGRRSPASSTASTTGRYCSAATAKQLRHAGQPPGHGQLQGAASRRVEPAQDRLADPVVAEAHRGFRARLHHQQAFLERRAPAAAPPRPPARRSRSAAGSARLARRGTPSPPAARARRATRQAASTVATSACPRWARTAARVPPPAARRRRQHAVAAQRVEQLHGLVRVAARAAARSASTSRRGGRARHAACRRPS